MEAVGLEIKESRWTGVRHG